MKARAFAAAAALGLLWASAAFAQKKPDLEKAKQHYQSAEEAASAEQWGVAAREYLVAYEITGDPVLFYKVGHAFDQAGDCPQAVVYYRRYLEEGDPEAIEPFREKTEGLIAACEEKVEPASEDAETGTDTDTGTGTGTDTATGTDTGAESSAPEKDPLSPPEETGTSGAEDFDDYSAGGAPPAFVDEEPSWQQTAAWASVGGVVAFGTIGAVLALSAESREEDIENLIEFRDSRGNPASYAGNTAARYDDLVDEGASLERYSMVAFAAAGVTAGAAAVFFILDATRDEEPEGGAAAEIAPTFGPETLGASARWRF